MAASMLPHAHSKKVDGRFDRSSESTELTSEGVGVPGARGQLIIPSHESEVLTKSSKHVVPMSYRPFYSLSCLT